MKYITYKHKPGKRGWYVFSATTARKIIKLIQIKEALNIKAHITQKWWCFCSVNFSWKKFKAQWNQGITYNLSQGLQERVMFFQCNYLQTKKLGNTVLHKVSNSQLIIAGGYLYWTICVALTLYNKVLSRTFVLEYLLGIWRV